MSENFCHRPQGDQPGGCEGRNIGAGAVRLWLCHFYVETQSGGNRSGGVSEASVCGKKRTEHPGNLAVYDGQLLLEKQCGIEQRYVRSR